MRNDDWASIQAPVSPARSRKSFLIALIVCLAYSHVYSQSCNCPPVNSCGACLGGFVDMTFRYNGALAVTVSASDNSGPLFFDILVSNGETFNVEGSVTNGMFLGNQLQLRINGILNYTFDTSCGQPLAVGSNYGAFTLISAESLLGGPLCCNSPLLDTVAPVISNCPTDVQVSLGPSSCSTTANWVMPTASDNCGDVTLTSTKSPGDSFGSGTTAVTYTAADDYGNISTCTFNVTVVDDINPTITGCPTDIVVNANAACEATVTWTIPSVSDNCPGTNLTSTKNPGSIFPLGTTAVTYTATDAAGNVATCSFNVIVEDNTDPVITGCPLDIVVSANASCVATVTWTAPTFSDNCAGSTLTTTRSPGSVFAIGTTLVTYTATDASGNTATCSFNVTVEDNIDPVIFGCPSDIVVNANASCAAAVTWTAPTVSDNCTGSTLMSTKSPGSTFSLGTTPVTYTATDAAGNTVTCSFNVTVVDNTDPVISGCPSDIIVNANGTCVATVTWTVPTVSDNCVGATLTSTKSPGATFSLGSTQVTYTARDAAGNTTVCSFNVIVQDNTNPVITGCSSNIVVNANASCEATVNWTPPTAADNCSSVTLTSTKAPGSIFSIGTTVVTYTAIDGEGNVSTCSFNVTVEDGTNPVITGCPSNILANANGSCQAIVNWTPPTATDNCSTVTLTSTKNPGSVFPIGTTVVTYTATDTKGNASTCSFNVTVRDDTDPMINNCPADLVVNANASCEAMVTWTPPTAADNCSTLTLTSTKNPGDIFPLGPTAVIYTATDAAGNTSECSFTVTVTDNVPPAIIGCPADLVVSADASCRATVNWIVPTSSDNCGSVTLSSLHTPGSSFPLGTTQVTYTATDDTGNTSSCSFNIIVKDQVAPVFAPLPVIKVNAGAACTTPVNWSEPIVTDCSSIELIRSHHPGENFSIGTTEVTYTATDTEENSSTLKFNVIVEDKTPPAFSGCPQDVIHEVTGTCTTPVSWSAPTVSDNCDNVTMVSSHNPGDIFPVGSTGVTYTATDAYGNISVCEFQVVVKSKAAPIFTDCPADIAVKSDEKGEAVVDWALPRVTSACGDPVVTASHQPGSIFPVGSTVVQYVAEDTFGNKSYCQFDVVVAQQEIDISISQVVTPDGNGTNDAWIVTNIEKFQNNKVVVVDRWGSVIYSATGYNNDNVAWRGHNQAGTLVPVGTYFYTISIQYGKSSFEKSGFIELIH